MLQALLRGRHALSPTKSSSVSQRLFQLSSCNFKSALEEVKTKERYLDPVPHPPKMKMEPYVKNLFFGSIDPNVFAYPQLKQRSLDVVEEMKGQIEKFMTVEDISMFKSGDISAETVAKLKELGVFKLNIPERYGGMELSCTEMLRLCEVFSKDLSLFHMLNTHLQYISPLFCNFASDAQREEYLPALASGDLQIGFALWEENAGTDISKLNCNAMFLGDKYVLSGKKKWVCNGGIADKFIVFATERKSTSKEMPDAITCFLVDKHSNGITAESIETLGINGCTGWELTFDQVEIPKENVIGGQGQGLSILKSLLYGKFTLAGSCSGLLRDLLDTTIKHAINKETFGKPLIENDLIKNQLAEAAARIYALESIAYLTADFYDNIEDPDIEAEVAIVKLYSCETLLFVVEKCLSILGSDSYLKNKPYERILRDVLHTKFVETSCETLRMTIALLGLRHVGANFQAKVIQMRNPLHYPKQSFRYIVQTFINNEDEIGFSRLIFDHVHPTLELSAEYLEKAILKFGRVTEDALTKWGAEIDSKQINLGRLADIAVDLYISTAVLARTSRSICIGLRDCEIEGNIANAIILDANKRFIDACRELERSPYSNNDANYLIICKALIHARKYQAAHPLTRNF